MRRYMLDTNTCIYIMRDRPPEVRARLRAVAVNAVAVSAIVVAELAFGVAKSRHPQKSRVALDDFFGIVEVLDWPEAAAPAYAEMRAALERAGKMIGANDLLIAAHACHLGAVLVTNNVREFERVPDLAIENWVGA